MKKFNQLCAVILMCVSLSVGMIIPVSAQENEELLPMEIQEFVEYLNETYTEIDTPMGTITLEHDYMENDSSIFNYDYWIQSDWEGVSPYDIKYSIKFTSQEIEETKEVLRNIQEKIAEDAQICLPDKKIEGGYYKGFYKYPYSRVGYETIRFLTWRNYSGGDDYSNSFLDSFGWYPTSDDYDFVESDAPIHESDFLLKWD